MLSEPVLRLGIFAVVLVSMAVWELLQPARPQVITRRWRWPANLGIAVLNTLILRVVLPVTAVGVAAIAAERGWGVFNLLALPGWLEVAVALVLLDLVIYLQHVVFHAVPMLWRLHRMHHADLEFDTTTGIRFHPLEMLLSAALKLLAVVALGAPPVAVIIFEVLLNATALFNHGNVRLPPRIEAALRWIVVTPDMHRVHHSILPQETDSNFGFNLPWWDRLFATYRAQPEAGHEGMVIGIELFRDCKELAILRMLRQPFR